MGIGDNSDQEQGQGIREKERDIAQLQLTVKDEGCLNQRRKRRKNEKERDSVTLK